MTLRCPTTLAFGWLMLTCLVACGGNNDGTTTPPPADTVSRLVPEEVRLTTGQQARFAVIGNVQARRSLEVEVLGWSIADTSVATVAAQADGTAIVTARQSGVTTLTARTANGFLTATIRVGAVTLSDETLAGLADGLTDAARRGELSLTSPTLPRGVTLADNVLRELSADAGLPARLLAIFVNPAAYATQPLRITPADLSVVEPFEVARAADGAIELNVRLFLDELTTAGADVAAFLAAVDATRFHQEGAPAAGLTLPSDVPAVTFFPGASFYNGALVYVGDAHAHTVFDADTAANIRSAELVADELLTDAGATVIHELCHVILERLDRGDLDDAEDIWATRLEALLRAKFDVLLTDAAGDPDSGALQRYDDAYAGFVAEPVGLALLEVFGLGAEPN